MPCRGQPFSWTGRPSSAFSPLPISPRIDAVGGGRITFLTSNVTLLAESARAIKGARTGDFVCVTVEDTGTGMTRETLDHASEAFFSTKHSDVGSGLGLFSVAGFLREANGFLQMSSVLGKGTSVSFYLPRAAAEDQGASQMTSDTGHPGS